MRTKSKLNLPGIYKISNTDSGKMYIGSAFNILKRWKSHRNTLRRNKHVNKHLQAAANKYGLQKMKFEVIEFMDSDLDRDTLKTQLLSKEQFWMDKFQSWNRKNGYNLCPKAGSPLGVKHSKESRIRMSEAHQGNRHTANTKQKISKARLKPVYQISIDTGELVNKFDSVLVASKKTKIQKTGISMCCRNVIRQSGGYHWTYDIKTFKKPSMKRKTIKRAWKQRVVTDGKNVWDSVKSACEDLNLKWYMFNKKLNNGEFFYV
jgi:group I intron endonuclease